MINIGPSVHSSSTSRGYDLSTGYLVSHAVAILSILSLSYCRAQQSARHHLATSVKAIASAHTCVHYILWLDHSCTKTTRSNQYSTIHTLGQSNFWAVTTSTDKRLTSPKLSISQLRKPSHWFLNAAWQCYVTLGIIKLLRRSQAHDDISTVSLGHAPNTSPHVRLHIIFITGT